ncbi:SDR family NAD(P)-dependent oxidoreductase [Prauserella flavalba]|uniref:SDR family NAD(P)-dependent oxidoreductase n=1 Tax=Prauserella flavalba TaxID=1477506 RepID=UPI0036E51D3F
MGVLEGKAVVITGAGRGLGRAYAMHAAGHGAAVVVNDVDGEQAEKVAAGIVASGGLALSNGDSVTGYAGASAIVEACVERFGALDGLVNNAGLNYQVPPWADDPDRVRALVEVNVLGSLYCGMAAIPVMRRQGHGAIVNIVSGSMLGKSNGAAYSASKGAVAAATYSWATDLSAEGIRVNAVSPLAWTRMVEADAVERERLSRDHTPERVAPLVTYLLSDLSSGITGQVVRSTGDALHLVRQPAVKEPVLRRETWEVEDIARAFETEFADVLEPPPAQRWLLPG